MASKDESRSVSIYINGDKSIETVKNLTQESKKLRNELYNLTDGTEAFRKKAEELHEVNEKLAEIKEDVEGVGDSLGKIKENFTEVFETLGIALGAEELVEFGKDLLEIAAKASGVERAFTKIGDTTGVIDKMREATKGMMTDMDLEKLAVEANEFSVPLSKLPLLLTFAAERARDTGKDVTDLTTKLVEGLGKKGSRSLNELGISSKEFNDELKVTPDRVDAIANIITRRMADAGDAVDNLGDRVEQQKIKWESFKEWLSGAWEWISEHVTVTPTWNADQDDIKEATNAEMKKFKALESMKDAELDTAIKTQSERIKKLREEAIKLEKEHASTKDDDKFAETNRALNENEVQRAAAANVASALANQKATRVTNQEENGIPGTVEFIEKQITDLQKLQKELSKSSDEWKKYQAQIDALTKQKIAITGKADDKKGESEREAAAKKYADLLEQLKQFNASELADTMAKNDKEVKELQNKYDKEIATQREFLQEKGKTPKQVAGINTTITGLDAAKNKAVTDLIAKQDKDLTDKIIAFKNQIAVKVDTERQKEIDLINKSYDEQKAAAGTNEAQLYEIEINRQVSLNDAKLAEEKRLAEETAKIKRESTGEDDAVDGDKLAVKILKIRAAGDKEIAELKLKFSKELQATKEFKEAEALINKTTDEKVNQAKLEEAKKWQDVAVDGAQTLSNTLFTIGNRNSANESNQKIADLEKQKNAELSNKNLTETQKAAIQANFDKQEAAIKKQQWEAERDASESQALINGAIGAIKLWVNPGFPAALPLEIALAAETLSQVAVIASQPTPAFADGGYTAVDTSKPAGWVKRPTLFANSSTGRSFTAGEGYKSEYIISSEQLKDPVVADFVSTMEAHRGVRRFENGGYTSTSTNSAAASMGGNKGNNNDPSDRMDKIEQVMHDFISKQAQINAKPTIISRRVWEQEDATVTSIRNAANAG